jgi:hypothetical protein
MSIYEDLKPINLDNVQTYPLASRPSKVTVKDFAKPITEDSSLRDYLNSLSNILAVQSLRQLAAQMRREPPSRVTSSGRPERRTRRWRGSGRTTGRRPRSAKRF